jgi:acetyltransferase-like isoleucine patch superfamily enzyme
MIAAETLIFDSSGHPSDPEGRLKRLPLRPEDVRPITIGDNVWIGQRSIITPGVVIGEGSIVWTASVVLNDVPPYTVVAGYPARQLASLRDRHPQGVSVHPLEAVAPQLRGRNSGPPA